MQVVIIVGKNFKYVFLECATRDGHRTHTTCLYEAIRYSAIPVTSATLVVASLIREQASGDMVPAV